MERDGEEYRHAYPTRHCSHLRSRALESLGVGLAFGVVHGHTLGGGGTCTCTRRVTDLLFVHHESYLLVLVMTAVDLLCSVLSTLPP